MITQIWSKTSSEIYSCYIKREGFTFFDVLRTIDANLKIEFRTIGGYDDNNTYMEHSIIDHTDTKEPIRNESDLSVPYKLFSQKWLPDDLAFYLDNAPFTVTRFGFETDSGFFCQNINRYSCDSFSFQIPNHEINTFFEALLAIDGDVAAFLYQAKKYDSCFLLYENEVLKIIVPNIHYIDLFLENEFLELTDLFL
jgi:hypothetical protein